MSRWLVLALALALGGCAGDQRARKEDPSKPRHLVVLVHGIAGEPGDFGSMAEALERHLAVADTGYRWQAVSFAYDTGHDVKDTQHFARRLGEFVRAHLPRANDADRFSVVCHSQGGLVTSLLVYNTLAGLEGFAPGLLEHMDAWVTLGTPFWGAKTAAFGLPFAESLNPFASFLPGTRQLADMTFGSDAIFAMRHALIGLSQQGRRLEVRALNLAGYVPAYNVIAPLSEGANEFESDTAVLLPSARMDFLYAVDQHRREPMHKLGREAFAETRFADHYGVVVGLHWLPFEHVQSLVDVPDSCVEHAGCEHPTFGYVLRHLRGDRVRLSDTHLQKMTGFLLDLNLQLEPGHGVAASDVQVQLATPPAGVEISRLLEPYSRFDSDVVEDPRYVRVALTGTIEGAWDGERFADTPLTFSLHVPGYAPRVIEAVVRPTWSTFVDVALARAE
jgi:pimeloyl-ACP methyl ester carboxylesterase